MPTGNAPRLCRVAGRDTWHIYYRDENNRRYRVTTGRTSRAEAELDLAKFIKDQAKPKHDVISVEAILDDYLADRRAAQRPGADRLRYAHKPLRRAFGNLPPQLIDADRSRTYTAQRRHAGISDATIRTELQALGAALRWAAKRKLIEDVPDIELPLRPEPRPEWLTREEAHRLIAAAKAYHLRLFIQIGLRTGARSGAILKLLWERVDLQNHLIDFREPGVAQTRKRKVVQRINATLLPILQEADRIRTTDYVIEWNGNPVLRIKNGFREAVIRAQLRRDITPHTLRHTAVTWMLQDGVPVWEVANHVGMSADMVQRVYGHHHPDFGRRAAAALE